MSVDLQSVTAAFVSRFGRPPTLAVRAPGRVNIIGEHTDYNAGFVLPMAIERETVIAAAPRVDAVIRAWAANLERSAEVSLNTLARHASEPWLDYIVGVAAELGRLSLPLSGCDILIYGNVPVASGLSSSASLEMAALVLFESLGGFHLEGADGPLLGQRVENDFLGLKTGIMDQFIVRMGKAGHALFLDCRTLEYELVPAMLPQAVFVIADTGVARGLAASKYNERVAECAQAVSHLQAVTGKQGTHLRDFELEDLSRAQTTMPEVSFRRARHILTENLRTREACLALRASDARRLGILMNESDHSLRDDYEVTCLELDAMTAIARALPGCYGSRMTGAGFGGCTVSLVERTQADQFAERLMAEYAGKTGRSGAIIVSSPAQGASRIDL